MARCPNCGQKTGGDYCQWCGYPVMVGGRWEVEAKKEAQRLAKEEARKAREAEEAEKRAKEEAERLAREEAKKVKKAEEVEKRSKKEAERLAKKGARKVKEAGEAERRAREEAERLAKEQALRETEEARKAREVEEAEKRSREEAERLAKAQALKEAEEALREAEEARKAWEIEEAEKRAKEEAERLAEEEVGKVEEVRAEKKAEEIRQVGGEVYQGNFELVVPTPVGFERVKQLAERLGQVENLKVEWVGGSADEGAIIGISLQKPLDLIQIISGMPMVEKVDKKGEKIVVTLKAVA